MKVTTPTKMLDLGYMQKDALRAEIVARSLAEHLSPEELAAYKRPALVQLVHDAILRADLALEAQAAALNTKREKGDIDRYFGFGEPLAKIEAPAAMAAKPTTAKPRPHRTKKGAKAS